MNEWRLIQGDAAAALGSMLTERKDKLNEANLNAIMEAFLALNWNMIGIIKKISHE